VDGRSGRKFPSIARRSSNLAKIGVLELDDFLLTPPSVIEAKDLLEVIDWASSGSMARFVATRPGSGSFVSASSRHKLSSAPVSRPSWPTARRLCARPMYLTAIGAIAQKNVSWWSSHARRSVELNGGCAMTATSARWRRMCEVAGRLAWLSGPMFQSTSRGPSNTTS
jgi:hypothetical protein